MVVQMFYLLPFKEIRRVTTPHHYIVRADPDFRHHGIVEDFNPFDHGFYFILFNSFIFYATMISTSCILKFW